MDPASRGSIQTSYGHHTTPEQALAAAVILRAIEDLDSKDEQERWEATEFFLQPRGPWAEMRRFYFDAVGIDDALVHRHLVARLEPPERPDKKWTYHEIGDALPTDRAFTASDVQKITDLPTGAITSRLQILKDQGRVVRVDRGVYCVPEFEERYWVQREQAIDALLLEM